LENGKMQCANKFVEMVVWFILHVMMGIC